MNQELLKCLSNCKDISSNALRHYPPKLVSRQVQISEQPIPWGNTNYSLSRKMNFLFHDVSYNKPVYQTGQLTSSGRRTYRAAVGPQTKPLCGTVSL